MSDSLLGKTLNNAYRIDKMLADGGMSYVYLAQQIKLNRAVVLKVLRPGFNDEDFIQLFLREARVNSQINHPNIVSVFDFDRSEEGIVYLAMELLDGSTLRDVVEVQQGLSFAKALWVMEQVCAGVHAAHKLNIVHRDLKPANVMVCQVSGDSTMVKVLDFGISKPLSEEDLKHTRMGMVMGTPGYLSPEQISGCRDIDARADVYALGAIFYFILTGKDPFSGASLEIIMNKQLNHPPPDLASIMLNDSEGMKAADVIKKAMAVDREERYSDVKAFWQAVLNISGTQSQKTALPFEEPVEPIATVYQFVFKGEIQEGLEKTDVFKKLQRFLKLKDDQYDMLFGGRRIVVRKNLSQTNAQKYLDWFGEAGAQGYVEEMPSATRIVQKSNKAPDEPRSLPSMGMLEPISITEIQSGEARPSPQPEQSQVNDFISAITGTSKPERKPKRTKFIVPIALVATVLLGFSMWMIPAAKYAITDFWVYSIQGREAPRGVASDTIRIGMSAAFSGSAREIGQSMRLGIKALFNSVNENGGIAGRQLVLVDRDDGYEPDKAINNLEQFLSDQNGVLAMLGNVGTPTAKAILPQVLEHGIINFGTFSGASLLRRNPPDRYVFNYRASYAEETSALIHYYTGVEEIPADRIGVFYQNDSFGLDGLAGVELALREYGVHKNTVTKANYTRNTAQVESAVEYFASRMESIDAIILVSTYAASSAFIHEMRKRGYTGQFSNISFVGSRALVERLQEMGEDPSGIVVAQVVPLFDSYATGVLAYRDALNTYHPGEMADFVSLEGFIAASIFVEGLRLSGRYFSVEDLVNTLESIQGYELGIGTEISFSASDHQASQRVWGSVINSEGGFENLELETHEQHRQRHE